MIRVDIDTVDADGLLDTYGAGATVDVERSATEAGVYAAIGSIDLVAGTDGYTLWDPAGDSTSWYRWRASNADGDQHSAYSAAFQGIDASDPDAAGRYASIDDVVAGYNQDIPDALRTRIDDALADATDQITDLMGFDFFRHPASGTEAFTIDSVSRGRLCVHDGIVADSVTLIEVRSTIHGSWEELAAGDWELEEPDKPGHPSFHLRLTGLGSWSRWPCGDGLVRVTGARGWPSIPRSVRRATRDRARQLVAWDATRPGGPVGPEELGATPGPNRMPDTMYRLRHDFSAWELGLAQCEI